MRWMKWMMASALVGAMVLSLACGGGGSDGTSGGGGGGGDPTPVDLLLNGPDRDNCYTHWERDFNMVWRWAFFEDGTGTYNPGGKATDPLIFWFNWMRLGDDGILIDGIMTDQWGFPQPPDQTWTSITGGVPTGVATYQRDGGPAVYTLALRPGDVPAD